MLVGSENGHILYQGLLRAGVTVTNLLTNKFKGVVHEELLQLESMAWLP
jgi:hypothetical protein